MTSKTFLHTIDIISIVLNIKDILKNSYISNVYSIESGIILQLKKGDDKIELLIDIRGWVFLIAYEIERKEITNFVRILRKNIVGEKILNISTPYFDRYVKIELTNDFNLHIEFMQGGNIILEKDGLIVDSFRHVKYKDREIKPKINYSLPNINKVDILNTSPENLYDIIKDSKAGLIPTLFKKLGIPSEISEEACYILNISRDISVNKLNKDVVLKALLLIIMLSKEYINSNNIFIYHNDKKFIFFSKINYKLYKNYVFDIYEDMNKAINLYYLNYIKFIDELKKREKINLELEKKEKLINQIRLNLSQIENKINSYNNFILKIKQNITHFETILDLIKKYLYDKDYENIKVLLHKLWSNEFGNIIEIDKKEKTLLIEFNNEILKLNLNYNIMKNINELYSEIKKLKLAKEELEKKLKELEMPEEIQFDEKPLDIKEKQRKNWYENFLWFITSNNHLCIAGRDASQNETLIKKRTDEKDIIFHADIHGSPFTILKVDNKDVNEDELFEAAQFTVSYSSGWKYGFTSLNAYWVKKDQVSKKAPSGMYLSKGSFMIYGKKNMINNVPLKLAVCITNDEIKVYPFLTAQKKFKEYLILMPGSQSKEDAIKKILTWVLNKNPNINVDKIKNEISLNLPKGNFSIIENKS